MDDFNLGVLTTTFTPAQNCLSYVSGLIYTQSPVKNGSTTTNEYKYHTLGLHNTSSCYPPYYHIGTGAYYSPAMCPSGWYEACVSVRLASDNSPETRATCCPSGYTCMEPPPDSITWSTLSCVSTAHSDIYVTVPDDDYRVWSRVVQLQPVINAGAINVRWQSTDFVTTSASTSPSQPHSSLSSSISGLPQSTSSPIVDGHGKELSTVAKIGIGVGVGVGSLIVLAASALIFFLKRRSKKQKVGATPSDRPDVADSQTGINEPKPAMPSEAWALHQAELHTADNTHEMGTASNIHEINTQEPAVYPSPNTPWRSAQTSQHLAPNELPAN